MTRRTNKVVFILLTAFTLYLLYLLAHILTPFILGAILAYLTDPLVKRLEKWHIPHLLSVILVFLFIFGILALMILMLFPIIQNQIVALIDELPQIVIWTQETVRPWLTQYVNINTLKATLSANASKTAWVFSTVLSSGYTLIDWIVNIVLTPVVTFYLLRDWDRVVIAVRDILPKSIQPTVVKLTKQCDEVLSAFFRGQLLVMLSLCVIYGIGLTLVGLQVGFMIGIIGGLLSIVPYLGSIFVVVAASMTALIQFGTWNSLIWVLVVYLIGQAIEGYVLTPYLVGNRIGLHPVAVIFAIMAGGTLFGFFGVLVALPAAAVIMVLLRFLRHRYVLAL